MLNISIFIYFWANKIKNVFELKLNSEDKNILRISEAENCFFFFKTLNLGLKNVVLKKEVQRRCFYMRFVSSEMFYRRCFLIKRCVLSEMFSYYKMCFG